MKINYILEYSNKETGKACRANLGYNINFVKAAVFTHLEKGDYNVAVFPILEDCKADDLDNVEIIDAECEFKPDTVEEAE